MEFSFCYTWTDLDKKHKIRLESDNIEELPEIIQKGDIFVIHEVNRDGLVASNINGVFQIDRGTIVNHFSWHYDR